MTDNQAVTDSSATGRGQAGGGPLRLGAATGYQWLLLAIAVAWYLYGRVTAGRQGGHGRADS